MKLLLRRHCNLFAFVRSQDKRLVSRLISIIRRVLFSINLRDTRTSIALSSYRKRSEQFSFVSRDFANRKEVRASLAPRVADSIELSDRSDPPRENVEGRRRSRGRRGKVHFEVQSVFVDARREVYIRGGRALR